MSDDKKAETVEKVEKAVKKLTKTVRAKAESVAKKAVEKTAESKAAGKAAASAKGKVSETVYLQYLGKEINKEDILNQVKDIWTKEMKQKASDLKSVTLYLKPEENAAYYVINGDVTCKVDL